MLHNMTAHLNVLVAVSATSTICHLLTDGCFLCDINCVNIEGGHLYDLF